MLASEQRRWQQELTAGIARAGRKAWYASMKREWGRERWLGSGSGGAVQWSGARWLACDHPPVVHAAHVFLHRMFTMRAAAMAELARADDSGGAMGMESQPAARGRV